MGDDYLGKVIHNLTHRRFKGTSPLSIYQQGTTNANSFYDPRNIGNYDAGEINPEGRYATHYPANVASNTAGFSISDDGGNDRQLYYSSVVNSNANALDEKKGRGTNTASSGSASDYAYFNPFYEALLNPKSNVEMENIAQKHFIPHTYISYEEGKKEGRGTNAPSGASAIDYAMNNPYAFKSNFNTGKGLGASSSGSSSDYYSSNPFRVPDIQNETKSISDFMMKGGAIDWAKYLGYIKHGINKIPDVIEKAPRVLKKSAETLEHIKELREMLSSKKKEAPKYEPLEYEEDEEEDEDIVKMYKGKKPIMKAPTKLIKIKVKQPKENIKMVVKEKKTRGRPKKVVL